jgi:hypothetical protein
VQVIGPGIVTAIGLGLLTASWRRAGRDARILAHGKLVEGTVLEQVPPTDDELGRIRFRYQPDCAPPCEATEEVTGEYDPLSKLGAGDPVTVIYDPAEPAAGRALRPYLAAMLR